MYRGPARYLDGSTISHDPLTALGAGLIRGGKGFNMNARRTVLETVSKTPLIEFSTVYIFPPEAGEALTAVSNSASDTSNVMVIEGLDADKLEQIKVFVTTGTTPVNIDGVWSRVNAVYTLTKEIVGSVTVSGTNTYAVVPPDIQRSSLGVYSSPQDKLSQVMAVIPAIIKSGGAAAYVDGHLKFRTAYPSVTLGAFTTPFSYGLHTGGSSFGAVDNVIPIGIEGSLDYVVEAAATTNNVKHYVRIPIKLSPIK